MEPDTGVAQSGAMVATINGSSWSSTVIPGITGGTLAVYNATTNSLTITGTKVMLNGSRQSVGITVFDPKVGTDTLGLTHTGVYSIGEDPSTNYVTFGANSGYVTITKYDATNQLVSGTFSFTAQQGNASGNVVRVTNGSFTDVKWTAP